MKRLRHLQLPLLAWAAIGCGEPDGRDPVGPAETSQASVPLANAGPSVGVEPALVGAGFGVDGFPVVSMIQVVYPDQIPALTDPEYGLNAPAYLADDDFVLGVEIDGQARAYPLSIGWWHEIVNDVIGDTPVCVTFCPLTGTGLVFSGATGSGERLTLGVSGLLYNSNLVMYDRRDGEGALVRSNQATVYPQIYGTGVHGPRLGHTLSLLPVAETTWVAWRRLHPETTVVVTAPYGIAHYANYPYIRRSGEDYRTDDTWLISRISPGFSDNPNPHAARFAAKDRVLGLRVDGVARAYPFPTLGARQVINDELAGMEIVVVWSGDHRLALPYSRRVADRTLTFEADPTAERFPFALRDRETGSLWDATGWAYEGELSGQRLRQLAAHNAMWFAWVTFWPDTDVWLPDG